MADNTARVVLTGVDRSGPAFKSAQRNLEALQAEAAALSTRFSAIGAALGVGTMAAFFKSTVNGLDALKDLSQATGSSVENLSALEDIALRTGGSLDTVSSALLKFNKDLNAADPDSNLAETLKQIGLSAEELRKVDPAEALRQVSLAIAQYSDDGQKARLIQELFGKSTRDVAKFLHDLAEAGQLNAKVTTKQAEAAEEFNNRLSAMEKRATDAARSIVGDLLPGIEALTKPSDSAAESFSLLGSSAGAIKTAFEAVTVLGANVGFVLGGVGREIGAIAAQGAALARLDFQGFHAISDAVKEDGRRARAELDALEKRLLGIDQPPSASASTDRRPKAPDPGRKKGGAAGGAAVDQISLLRKQLEVREQAIAQSLSTEQDIIKFNETFIETLYRSGNISLENTFTAQDELRRRHVDEVRRATEETVRLEQQFQASLPAPKNAAGIDHNKNAIEGSQGKIQAARAQLAAAERELDQAASLSAVTRPEQREQAQQQAARFNAALQDLVDGGKSRAAELADIAVKTREAEKQLVGNGVDPAVAAQQAQAFGQLLERQRQLNLARDEFAKITDRARDAEEALAIAQQNGGTGLVESERELAALRAKEINQLEVILELTRQRAQANPQNEALNDELRKLDLQIAKLKQIQDPTKVRADTAADNIGDAIANGLSRANTEGRKLQDTIKSIGLSVFDIFEREVITKPLAQQLAGLFKTADGGNPLTKIFGLGATGSGASSPGFSLGNVFEAPASTSLGGVSGFFGAGPQTGAGESGGVPNDLFKDLFGNLGKLGTATTASADVLGKLPQIAAIPATTALGTVATAGLSADTALIGLAAAAQLAAAALLQIGGSQLANGLAGSSGIGSLGLGGLIGGGGGFGSGANFGFLDLGLFLHDGGVAGEATDARPVPASAFANAVRYHSGGIGGEAPDAAAATPPGHIAAVLQAGEELVAPSDPRHRDNAGLSPMRQLIAKGGIVVQRLSSPIPGLAPDEVPALLPRGMEVLTASDPRHSANRRGASGYVDVLGQFGLGAAQGDSNARTPLEAATAAAVYLQDDALPKPHGFEGLPRYHSGGIVGASANANAWATHTNAALAASEPRHGDNGGDSPIVWSPTFMVPAPTDRRTQEQLARIAFTAAQRANNRGTA